uniref:Uncharacterized protein n=1 Tax=Plectus sambesii TaxID=2011161 RepID=A0A914X5I9_9BILA
MDIIAVVISIYILLVIASAFMDHFNIHSCSSVKREETRKNSNHISLTRCDFEFTFDYRFDSDDAIRGRLAKQFAVQSRKSAEVRLL